LPLDTFLLDLDGTLVDSVADLATAVNLLRADLDLPPLDTPTVRGYVGDGAGMLVRRALPQGAFTPTLLQQFLIYYEAHLLEQTFIYPGIMEFLESHRHKKMAVVTNKPHRHSLALLRGLGLLPYFGSVIGGDSCTDKKPHPAQLHLALAELESTSQKAVMIGDHHTDLRAGVAAGVKTCFCSWGLGGHDGLPYDYLAETPHDLCRLFPGESP
jgi:phosphoglycolate phosphatase